MAKYKSIQGEWSVKDIERFVEDLTGASALREEMKTLDTLNHRAIAGLRDGQERVSPSLASDFQEVSQNLQPFIEAGKKDSQ